MNIDKDWLVKKIKECEGEIEVADELIEQLNSDLLSVVDDREKMKLALEFNDLNYKQIYKKIVLYLSLTMHCSNSITKEAHTRGKVEKNMQKVDELLEHLVSNLNRTVEFMKETRISMWNEEKNIAN